MATLRQNDKTLQEKLQMIISELLKDEENKYCADCDAKGPRWASWNLGVLLCIRCAGIHRGLGVHISKVKSLNLDSWETQQVAVLKAVGNRRARQLYEANLPEFFRRPQTDSALEQFIRAKYEQKRYVASDFVPPKPDIESLKKELLRLEQICKRKAHPARAINLQIQSAESSKPQVRTLKSIAKSASSSSGGGTADILGLSSPSTSRRSGGEVNSPSKILETAQNSETSKKESAGSFSADLLGLSFDEPSKPAHQSGVAASSELMSSGNGEQRPTTKESILALYNLSKPAPTVPAPSVAEANRGDLLFPPVMQPNGQNGNAAAHPLFAAPATPGQVQSPPTYQPSAPQPTTTSNLNWSSLRQQQQPQPALRAHPPSVDLFDNMDVFQSAGPAYAAKPVSQWDNAFSSGVNQPTTGAPFSFQTPSQPQPQWPSSTAFQQTPVATTAATNLKPPSQHSYLAQIQSQLASMQLRSETVE